MASGCGCTRPRSAPPENREEQAMNSGHLKPGQSGNPGGRPKQIKEIEELARQRSAEALDSLTPIAVDSEQPGSARVAAAIAILDRGYGKPAPPLLIPTLFYVR